MVKKKVTAGTKKKFEKFSLTLVGMNYRMGKQERLQLFNMFKAEGEAWVCYLEPEPQNPVDPKAIKVMLSDSVHIGYVQRPVNEPLFDLLQKGAIVESCLLVEFDPFEGRGDLKVKIRKPVRVEKN